MSLGLRTYVAVFLSVRVCLRRYACVSLLCDYAFKAIRHTMRTPSPVCTSTPPDALSQLDPWAGELPSSHISPNRDRAPCQRGAPGSPSQTKGTPAGESNPAVVAIRKDGHKSQYWMTFISNQKKKVRIGRIYEHPCFSLTSTQCR